MSASKGPSAFVSDAYGLGQDKNVVGFYQKWADDYDNQMLEVDYVAPTVIAQLLCEHVSDKSAEILDVGCGKGFLLFELLKILPGLKVTGLDISEYAINNSKAEVKPFLQIGDAKKLPFKDNSFDLVISINTIHNLYCFDMLNSLKEIERVGKANKYLVVESYQNLEQKTNMMYWVLTGECFFSDDEWLWWFDMAKYTGDYSFIYFD